MRSRKFIPTLYNFINEQRKSKSDRVDFDSFPRGIRDTLMNEYDKYFLHNYDWNTMQNKFRDDHEGFREWREQNASDEFIKNIDTLIEKTKEDISIKEGQLNTENRLKEFEELVIPTLGRSVLNQPLTLRDEMILLSNYDNIKDMTRDLSSNRGVLDSDGNLDKLRTTQSELFTDDSINLPAFEDFVKENPEFKGVFNDWKKLFDESIKMLTTPLNAFRSSTSLEQIRNLYNFLVEYKKTI